MASLLAVLACAQALPQDRRPVTAIVVRHAERAETPSEDPGLSAAGEARADTLVEVSRKANVTAIVTTLLLRTRKTAEPTAKALRITPEVVSSADPGHVQKVAAAVKAHAGKSVLVVGHSNTIPLILGALGVKESVAICEMEYDKIFVVKIPADGTVSMMRSTYGQPTPMDANCRSTGAAFVK
jgi:broad specificity phosphatase PhoE